MELPYADAANTALQTQSFDLMFCPSGTKPFQNGSNSIYTIHYRGIAGAKGPYPAGHQRYNSTIDCFTLTTGPHTNCYPVLGNSSIAHGGFANNGILPWRAHTRMRDITDGTSNTFLLGEQAWDPTRDGIGSDNGNRSWIQGANNSAMYAIKNLAQPIRAAGMTSAAPHFFNDISFGSEHPGGAQFVLGDAKVTFISENVDMSVYRGLASRESGEVVRVP